ncbi:MAG: hemE [Rickettsiaceae bacterium]|jgi:uroporphyrinogen decarboxylase|nr:hemE [Rickettsiaceae bacterium]
MINNPFLNTLSGNKDKKVPIWFMRQAGRYLPEYLKVRATTSNFLEFCYSPEKASEVTLQPISRFDFDAAIIFSDILVIPDALGLNVNFVKNEGPVLTPIASADGLEFDKKKLAPVYEAIKLTREKLPKEKSLIGFAGAPWTLATYMIEGGGSRDFMKTKSFMYQKEEQFSKIIDILIESVSKHLIKQIESGCDALQLFDSWAGVLTEEQFFRWSIGPAKKIVSNIKSKHKNTPIIGFPKGCGVMYKDYAEQTGVDVISFDQHIPCKWIAENVNIPVQGNLDPILLMANKEGAVKYTMKVIDTFKDKPLIFNLGHGILQNTPIENVEAVVRAVKNYA